MWRRSLLSWSARRLQFLRVVSDCVKRSFRWTSAGSPLLLILNTIWLLLVITQYIAFAIVFYIIAIVLYFIHYYIVLTYSLRHYVLVFLSFDSLSMASGNAIHAKHYHFIITLELTPIYVFPCNPNQRAPHLI